MNTLYYCVTEEGKFRALRKVNEYECYEPIMLRNKFFDRKTMDGLFKVLSKHIPGAFCLKEVK